MKRSFDTIVIGGGASGMAAAISAAEKQEQVLLLEKGDRLGRKILASGNGRCNLLNNSALRYFGDGAFAAEVLGSCTLLDLIGFFRRYGLYVTELAEGRMYPSSLQAASVVSALSLALKLNHVDVEYQAAVDSVKKVNRRFSVRLSSGQSFEAKRIVVSAGGAAQPKLGGCPDGYRLLQSFGHTVTEPFPALVPVMTDSKSISGLSGTRVHCDLALCSGDTVLLRESGELLFTDYGVSGICVMQCSRYIRSEGLHFEVDFLSRIIPDEGEALAEFRRRRKLFAGADPVFLLSGLVPDKVASAVLRQAHIRRSGAVIEGISSRDLETVLEKARHYRIDVLGTKGMDFAQVTAGGVSCAEFSPSTMESRLCKGLFASGEVLDVDGDCGGFNLMFAFASGIIAGRSFNGIDTEV